MPRLDECPKCNSRCFPRVAITKEIGFQCESGKVVYFYGHMPVLQHDADDVRSFRLFTSQLIERGTMGQGDITKALGGPLITVKRYSRPKAIQQT